MRGSDGLQQYNCVVPLFDVHLKLKISVKTNL